jgi:hypothetical protein
MASAPTAQLPQADVDRLGLALAKLLLASWRRRAEDHKGAAPADQAGAAEEVRDGSARSPS